MKKTQTKTLTFSFSLFPPPPPPPPSSSSSSSSSTSSLSLSSVPFQLRIFNLPQQPDASSLELFFQASSFWERLFLSVQKRKKKHFNSIPSQLFCETTFKLLSMLCILK